MNEVKEPLEAPRCLLFQVMHSPKSVSSSQQRII